MKKILLLCLFGIALTFFSLAGCKIQIDVPNGGAVITESGSYECLSGRVCTIDVYDIFFDETFVAIPDQGYRFLGWRKREKGLCGGHDQPCRLPTVGFQGRDVLMAILESDMVFYLTPVFDCDDDKGCYGFVLTDDPEVVFDWSVDRCETEDIPDLPARAFRDARGNIQLIATHFINRRMIGASLDTLVHECNVIMVSDRDPDPSTYNDKEWISAVYTTDGTKIHALVHNEYQGNSHTGMCPSGDYLSCWYNAITYATSEDMGQSYTHVLAPDHLVASVPYPYVPDEGPYGVFEGSNIIYNAMDGFYYKLLHLETRGEQEWGTGVMRTKSLEDPASWRCWGGLGFNISFINPYKDVDFDPVYHVCAPVSRENIIKMSSSVTYNTFLDKFLLVGAERSFDQQGVQTDGIYFSLSNDMIHWSERKLIMEANVGLGAGPPGDLIMYPSIIDPDDTSRNFEYSNQDMYLYYTRWHRGTTYDRDLVRVPLEIVVE